MPILQEVSFLQNTRRGNKNAILVPQNWIYGFVVLHCHCYYQGHNSRCAINMQCSLGKFSDMQASCNSATPNCTFKTMLHCHIPCWYEMLMFLQELHHVVFSRNRSRTCGAPSSQVPHSQRPQVLEFAIHFHMQLLLLHLLLLLLDVVFCDPYFSSVLYWLTKQSV